MRERLVLCGGAKRIQNWEQELSPIPRVTELACHEMLRRWKQRPDFGPVLVIYADGSIWQRSQGPYQISLLQRELCANNEIALQYVHRLRDDPIFTNPFIMDQTGDIIWAPSELLLRPHARFREYESKA